MDRPASPPQVIRSHDMYARDVVIWLNGECAASSRWFYVNAPAGFGERLIIDADGGPVLDKHGERFEHEHVQGSFEVRWRDQAGTNSPNPKG